MGDTDRIPLRYTEKRKGRNVYDWAMINCVLDSKLILDVMESPPSLEDLKKEVSFAKVYHKGGAIPRMFALQGSRDENSRLPLYRHPLDCEPGLKPFSPGVLAIKTAVERLIGSTPFNHCLLQLYRNGDDFIGEHADKTLDIERGSPIVNFSLGATRVLVLREKHKVPDKEKDKVQDKGIEGKGKESCGTRGIVRVPLPSNSCFVLGPETNRLYLHGIKADRRAAAERAVHEMGPRISFTFRKIATFVGDDGIVVGQGASSLAWREPVTGQLNELLLEAFSAENKTDGCFEHVYGPFLSGTR